MGCCSSGHGAIQKEMKKLPDALGKIFMRYEQVIHHSHLDIDIAAARAFGHAVTSPVGVKCDDVVRFIGLFRTMFHLSPRDLRWLRALDSCVWMLVKPRSGCPEDVLSIAIQGETKKILKMAETDTHGDYLRAMVIRWAQENAALAKDEALQSLTKNFIGQHLQSAAREELASASDHISFAPQAEEFEGEAPGRSWWSEGPSAEIALDALIRVSAFQGCMSEVICQHGAKLAVGKPRTAYLRSVISSVLWNFGSELLKEVADSVSKSFAKAFASSDKHSPASLDDQAVVLLVEVVKGLKLWLQGTCDPVIAALISDAANAAKNLDAMVMQRPQTSRPDTSQSGSRKPPDDEESSDEEMAALARNSDRTSVPKGSPKVGVDDASLELPCGFVFVEQVLVEAFRFWVRPYSKMELSWTKREEPNIVALQRAVAPGGKGRPHVVDFLAESLDVPTPVFVTTAILRELGEVFQQCDRADLSTGDRSVGIEDFFVRWSDNDVIKDYFHASRGMSNFVGIFQRLHRDGKASISWQGFEEQLTLDDDNAPAAVGPLLFPPHQIHIDTDALIARGLVSRVVYPHPSGDGAEDKEQAGDEARMLTSAQQLAEMEEADDLEENSSYEHHHEEAEAFLEYRLAPQEGKEEHAQDFGHGEMPVLDRGLSPASQGNVPRRRNDEYDSHHARWSDIGPATQVDNLEGKRDEMRLHTIGNTSHRSYGDSDDKSREETQKFIASPRNSNGPSASSTSVLQNALIAQQHSDVTHQSEVLKRSGRFSESAGNSYELSAGELPPSLETTMKESGSMSALSNQCSALSVGEIAGGGHSQVAVVGDQRSLQTIVEVDGTGDTMTPARDGNAIGESRKSPGQLALGESSLAKGTASEHTPGESTIHQNMCSPGSGSILGQLQINQSDYDVANVVASATIKPEMHEVGKVGKGRMTPEATLVRPRTEGRPPSKSGCGPLPPIPRPAEKSMQAEKNTKPPVVPPLPFTQSSPQPTGMSRPLVSDSAGMRLAEPEVATMLPGFGQSASCAMHMLDDIGSLRHQVEHLRAVLDNGNGALTSNGEEGVWFDYHSAGQAGHEARVAPRTALTTANPSGMPSVAFGMAPTTANLAGMPSAAFGSPLQFRASAWNTPTWGMPGEASFGMAPPLIPSPVQSSMHQNCRPVQYIGHHVNEHAVQHASAHPKDAAIVPTKPNDTPQFENALQQQQQQQQQQQPVTPSPDADEAADGIKAHLQDITRELADCRRQLQAQRLSTAVLTSELRASSAGHGRSQRMCLTDMPQLRGKSESPRNYLQPSSSSYRSPLAQRYGAGVESEGILVHPPLRAVSPAGLETYQAGWPAAGKHQPSLNFDESAAIKTHRFLNSSYRPSQHAAFYSPLPGYSTQMSYSQPMERSTSAPKLVEGLKQPDFRKFSAPSAVQKLQSKYPERLKDEMQRMDKRLLSLDTKFKDLLR